MSSNMSRRDLFDRRLVDRFIRRGMVRREDYEAHLEQLVDRESDAEFVDTDAILGAATTRRRRT